MPQKNKTLEMLGAPRKHMRADSRMEFSLEKFLEKHPAHDGPLDPAEISKWAIWAGLYEPKQISPVDQLRQRLSRHLSHRYFTDPQDREVRALHAVPTEEITPVGVKQGYVYYPLLTTEPEKIKTSLGVRRESVRNRVVQIETDRRSYNENNVFSATIGQMDFNFNAAAVESQLPTDYPESPPDDYDEDDDLLEGTEAMRGQTRMQKNGSDDNHGN